jgi:hypothetical protein
VFTVNAPRGQGNSLNCDAGCPPSMKVSGALNVFLLHRIRGRLTSPPLGMRMTHPHPGCIVLRPPQRIAAETRGLRTVFDRAAPCCVHRNGLQRSGGDLDDLVVSAAPRCAAATCCSTVEGAAGVTGSRTAEPATQISGPDNSMGPVFTCQNEENGGSGDPPFSKDRIRLVTALPGPSGPSKR